MSNDDNNTVGNTNNLLREHVVASCTMMFY